MRRTHVTLIIIITVLITLLANILVGDYIAARLATLPLIRKFNILQPRAPIVINNRETVRVNDANDAVETTNSMRTKMASLVYFEGDRIIQTGALLNWTADGFFITTEKAFGVSGKTYAVVLNSGDVFPVKTIYADTASSLILVETDAGNVPNIDTVDNKDLRPGQKILLVANSVSGANVTFLESYLRTVAANVPNIELSSDELVRGPGIQFVEPLLPGQPGITLEGKVAGIWTGDRLLSSEVIRNFANNFFNDNRAVNRPAYGFHYRQVSVVEAKASQLTPGAQVLSVASNGAAGAGGLLAGDIITAVNDKKVTDEVLLEELLEAIKPSGRATLDIVRKGANQTLVITPTLLK